MSTQKAKFALFSRLQDLGFTYEDACQLRRIEMTLQRWAERECGDGSDWAIERDEATGKPFNVYHGEGKPRRYAIADREAGALRRLAAIVAACNARLGYSMIIPYHQTDCRGCMLYLIRAADIPSPALSTDHPEFNREMGKILDQYYTRGLAVCT
jgi:hypothetical protein